MANALKKAVFGFMEKTFLHEGFVLNTRKWDTQAMVEIDLHLPDVDMSKWQTIQRLKCKVNEFEFRDYTPARWNAAKRTCTMYVETGHNGYGSQWADHLRAGDSVLFGPAHAAQLPSKPGKVLCLGDGSALGHFMAMNQLIDPRDYPLDGWILLDEGSSVPDDLQKEYHSFRWLTSSKKNALDELYQIIQHNSMQDYTSIYLAGNIPMISELRKTIKKNSYLTAKTVAYGFWK